MQWVAGVGLLGGLLLIAVGTAAIRTGRTLPWAGRRVTRSALYGLGALLVGVSCVVQGLFYFRIAPPPPWEIRFFVANTLMFSGLLLMGIGQLSPSHRRN